MTNAIGQDRLSHASPRHFADGDEGRQRTQRALWDLVEGLRLRDMWLRMSWNEVRRRYKRTFIGPMWVTLSVLVFALALSFVWAGIFNQPVKTFLPFLLAGIITWSLIAGSIGEACAAFLGGEGLMKSRQFPYSILIYIVLTRNVIILGHNLVGYVLVALICGVSLGWVSLLALPGIALVVLNCGWMCMLTAILCLRFRDVQQTVASVLQVLVFVTPVFWQVSQLQGKRAIIVHANPFHYMVDVVRQPLLGTMPSVTSYLVCTGCALAGWLLAFQLLARKRHRLAYWF